METIETKPLDLKLKEGETCDVVIFYPEWIPEKCFFACALEEDLRFRSGVDSVFIVSVMPGNKMEYLRKQSEKDLHIFISTIPIQALDTNIKGRKILITTQESDVEISKHLPDYDQIVDSLSVEIKQRGVYLGLRKSDTEATEFSDMFLNRGFSLLDKVGNRSRSKKILGDESIGWIPKLTEMGAKQFESLEGIVNYRLTNSFTIRLLNQEISCVFADAPLTETSIGLLKASNNRMSIVFNVRPEKHGTGFRTFYHIRSDNELIPAKKIMEALVLRHKIKMGYENVPMGGGTGLVCGGSLEGFVDHIRE